MKSSEFCYWLQGLFELADPKSLDEKQTNLIKRHLALVFKHEIDPSYSDDPAVLEELQQIHDGNPNPSSRRPPRPSSGGTSNMIFKC